MYLNRLEQRADELRLLGLMITQGGETLYSNTWDHLCRRNVYSVSKSFTSLAVGFAVQEGLLRLEERLVDLFPDEVPAAPDKNLQKATLRDTLTMCLGQDVSLLMSAQRIKLAADDWATDALKTPFLHAPGTHFVYSNAGPYLAGLAVQKRAGCNLVEYLMPRLFTPLGIKRPTWEVDPLGRTFGAGGLMLVLPDLHKLGLLLLQQGRWEGAQLISPDWIRESSRKQVENGEEGYGYLLWRGKYNSFRADGLYGQYSIVLPDRGAVISTAAENRHQKQLLQYLLDEIVPQL